jgi:hypothetical protein
VDAEIGRERRPTWKRQRSALLRAHNYSLNFISAVVNDVESTRYIRAPGGGSWGSASGSRFERCGIFARSVDELLTSIDIFIAAVRNGQFDGQIAEGRCAGSETEAKGQARSVRTLERAAVICCSLFAFRLNSRELLSAELLRKHGMAT